MDSNAHLSPGLRVPAGGEHLRLTVSSDLGPEATVGAIAARLDDVQAALELGERWGLQLAETAARQTLRNRLRLRQHDPEAMSTLYADWPELRRYGPGLERALVDPEHWYFGLGRREGSFGQPEEIVALVSSSAVPGLLGPPMWVERLEYRNPIEVVLIGAGLILTGSVKVLRMVRDWSSQRRIGDATADAAEATARQCKSRADLGAWLVEEAKAGRQPVPIGDLVRVVATEDLAALSRLADTDLQLSLPSQLTENGQG